MSTQTHRTVPGNSAAFITDLSTFLKNEDADRFEDQFDGFVVSGGLHSTAAGLTGTPSAFTGYPGGYYTTETASITYQNNKTQWVIAHSDTTGDLGTFTRVSGTHYLLDTTSGTTKPSLPTGTIWLMQVVTSGGAITAVSDLRNRTPSAVEVFVSVKRFGAIGDGVTDDTAAIQAAIDSFSYPGQDHYPLLGTYGESGGVLFFPRGVYKVTSTLLVGLHHNSLTLMGEGFWSSAILGTSGVANLPVVKFLGARECRVTGLFIQGVSTSTCIESRTSATASTTSHLTVDNSYLIGQYCLKFDNTDFANNNELARVYNCVLSSTDACIYTNSVNTEGHELYGCIYGGTGRIAHIVNGSVHLIGGEAGVNNSGALPMFEIDSAASGAGWDTLTVTNLKSESTAYLLKYTGSSSDIHADFLQCSGLYGVDGSAKFLDFRGTGSLKFTNCNMSVADPTTAVVSLGGGTSQKVIITNCNMTPNITWNGFLYLIGNVGGTGGNPTRTPGASATLVEFSTGLWTNNPRVHFFRMGGISVVKPGTMLATGEEESLLTSYVKWNRTNLTIPPAANGEQFLAYVDTNGWNMSNWDGSLFPLVRVTSAGNLSAHAQVGVVNSTNGYATIVKHATATLSSSAAATLTSSNLIPAGSTVIGVTMRVLTGFGVSTGLTSFQMGDGTDADRWGATCAITLNSTSDTATITTVPYYAAATSIVLTANGGNFDATGQVRLVVHYLDLTAPTS